MKSYSKIVFRGWKVQPSVVLLIFLGVHLLTRTKQANHKPISQASPPRLQPSNQRGCHLVRSARKEKRATARPLQVLKGLQHKRPPLGGGGGGRSSSGCCCSSSSSSKYWQPQQQQTTQKKHQTPPKKHQKPSANPSFKPQTELPLATSKRMSSFSPSSGGCAARLSRRKSVSCSLGEKVVRPALEVRFFSLVGFCWGSYLLGWLVSWLKFGSLLYLFLCR